MLPLSTVPHEGADEGAQEWGRMLVSPELICRRDAGTAKLAKSAISVEESPNQRAGLVAATRVSQADDSNRGSSSYPSYPTVID